MFFVPRAQPEVRNTTRFMVECTNVTFYSDGFIKTRFGPAGRKGIFFVRCEKDAIYSGSNNWVLVQINGNWFKLNSVNLKVKK